MSKVPSRLPPAALRAGLARTALLGLAALVCAMYGYDFGVQIGGRLMGLVAAASSALFGWLLVSGLLDQVLRLVRKLRPPA